jgi:hypothetical protein
MMKSSSYENKTGFEGRWGMFGRSSRRSNQPKKPTSGMFDGDVRSSSMGTAVTYSFSLDLPEKQS